MSDTKLVQRDRCGRLHLDTWSSLLSLGSWLLLVILDVASPQLYSEDSGRQASRIAGFTILAVAGLAFIFGVVVRYTAERALLEQLWPSHAVVPQSVEDKYFKLHRRPIQAFWSVFVHSVLLIGAVAWVSLQAVGGHDSQVLIGLSTLYCLVSLSFFQCLVDRKYQCKGDSDKLLDAIDLLAAGHQPMGIRVSSKITNGERVISIPLPRTSVPPLVRAASMRTPGLPKTRWTPLFKDPSFRRENLRRMSRNGSIGPDEESPRRASDAAPSLSSERSMKEEDLPYPFENIQRLMCNSRQDIRKSWQRLPQVAPVKRSDSDSSGGFSDVSEAAQCNKSSSKGSASAGPSRSLPKQRAGPPRAGSPDSSEGGLSDISAVLCKVVPISREMKPEASEPVVNNSLLVKRPSNCSICSGFSDVSVDAIIAKTGLSNLGKAGPDHVRQVSNESETPPPMLRALSYGSIISQDRTGSSRNLKVSFALVREAVEIATNNVTNNYADDKVAAPVPAPKPLRPPDPRQARDQSDGSGFSDVSA